MVFTYILLCADDTFYIGHTEDLASREATHNGRHGGSYTSTRCPVRMVYAEEYPSLSEALARERQLKRWTTSKKRALVLGDLASIKSLARRRVEDRSAFTWQDLLKRS